MNAVAQPSRRVALVVSDVDGTLLDNNKQLTPGAPAAVQRLYAGWDTVYDRQRAASADGS